MVFNIHCTSIAYKLRQSRNPFASVGLGIEPSRNSILRLAMRERRKDRLHSSKLSLRKMIEVMTLPGPSIEPR